MSGRGRYWIIIVLLCVLTFLAYKNIGRCGFVNFDDPSYVFDEPMVNSGLRSASFIWAFTATHNSNWHPLTSLSHMLDCSLFGISPRAMHWENVFWHTLNAILVFLVWRKLTGAIWRSAIVAALFALHPLHVESVAWISERKDVLSGFFFLLSLWSYASYAQAENRARPSFFYYLSLAFFALGLISKPMLVTVPFVLLLLDFWPLRRWPARSVRQLCLEKAWFAVLAVVSSFVTFLAQRSTGATRFGLSLDFSSRAGNAIVSYVRYLGKTFWPDTLAIYYPHPGSWPVASVVGALLLLIVVSGVAIRYARSAPWFLFGWLWFLGTLVPVLGLVQVGGQSMADRYTYIPLLGMFTLLVWTVAEIVGRFPILRVPSAILTLSILGSFVWLTQKQVLVWENGITLFQHNLTSTAPNARAHVYLADALEMAGRPEREVIDHCQRALDVEPKCIPALRVQALMQLSRLARQNQHEAEARSFLDEAHRVDPANSEIEHVLGMMSLQQGQPDDALAHFHEALRINPSQGATRRILAQIFFRRRRLDEARAQLQAAIDANAWDYLGHEQLGILLKFQGQSRESREQFARALWINPRSVEAARQLSESHN